jgi:hypothetical protein
MDYMESKKFQGTLSSGESSLEVSFSARIDDAGEVQFEFESIPLDRRSAFIQTDWDPPGHDFGEFALVGVAEDGAAFDTDNLIFTTVGWRSTTTESTLNLSASCSEARFRMKAALSDGPVAKLFLKGFRTSPWPLVAETQLGTARMLGVDSLDELPSSNSMSGRIQVEGGANVEDANAWRARVDDFVEHLRHIMSFASGVMLHTPLFEFIHDGQVELVALSQPRQETTYMAPFSHRALQPIFKRTVETYFNPPFAVDKLHYAISWYCMNSTYVEANLITAMTVLENLISSNLSKAETEIQEEADFKKLRKKISNAAKEHFADMPLDAEEQQRMVADVNEKLNDINRRTLKQKIDILGGKWGMSLGALTEEQIKGAKKARDSVVHQGFYEHAPGKNAELFEHMLVARELVVRLILTVLQFDGSYRTYLDGIRDQEFHLLTGGAASERRRLGSERFQCRH